MADLTYHAKLTTVGTAKWNASQQPGGPAFTLSEMAIDDGNGSVITPDPAQTELINEVYRAPLNFAGVDPLNPTMLLNTLVIPAIVPEGGFWCRGYGIFDADGDLVIVGNMPAIEKPGPAQGAVRPQKINVRLVISGEANVQMIVDHSEVYTTMEYVDNAIKEAILLAETSINLKAWEHLKVGNNWSAAINAALASDYSTIYIDATTDYYAPDLLTITRPKRLLGLARPRPKIHWGTENRPNGGNMFQSVGNTTGLWIEGLNFTGNRPNQTSNTVTGQDFAAFHLRTGNLQNITFVNNLIQEFGCPDGNAGAGILAGALSGTNRVIDNIRIEGNEFQNIRNVPGVYINGDAAYHQRVENVFIERNTFRNGIGITARQNCIYVLGALGVYLMQNFKINENIFRMASTIDVCIEVNHVDRGEIIGNDIEARDTASLTGILIREQAFNIKVLRNSIINKGTGNAISDATHGIALVSISVNGLQQHIEIEGNTVKNFARAISLSSGTKNVRATKNAIQGESSEAPILSAFEVANADDIDIFNNTIDNAQYPLNYYSGKRVLFDRQVMTAVGDGAYGAIMEAQVTPPAEGLIIRNNKATLRPGTPWLINIGPVPHDTNRIEDNEVYSSTGAMAPVLNPYHAYRWGTITKGASTTRATQSTTTDVVKCADDVLDVAIAANSQLIAIARICQVVMSGTANITGGGHPVGILGNCAVLAGAGNAPQAIAIEGRVDVYPGYNKTLGTIKPLMSLAQLGGGTHPLVSMSSKEIAISSGVTVSELRGSDLVMIQQLGSVGKVIGTYFPDMSALTGIAEKWAFKGLDELAPIHNRGAIVSSAWGSAAPATGATITIPPLITDFQIAGASTLAALTINLPLPANCVDGQEVAIGFQMTVTALTINTPAGSTMLNKPTTVSAGGVIRYKFLGRGVNTWVRR